MMDWLGNLLDVLVGIWNKKLEPDILSCFVLYLKGKSLYYIGNYEHWLKINGLKRDL